MKKLPDFITDKTKIDKHQHLGCRYQYYEVAKGDDPDFFEFLRERVQNSYVDAGYLAKVLKNEGFSGVAKLLEDKFPSEKASFGVRTGDFGEAVTEILFEDVFDLLIPVKKLRYKINKDKPSFGIDVIAFKFADNATNDVIVFSEVKASKHKTYGIDEVLRETDELAAYTDKGKQKTRSTIRFISERLFDNKQYELDNRISKFLEETPNQQNAELYVTCLIRDIATWGHDALDGKSFSNAPLERTLVCVCALESFEKAMDEAYKIPEAPDNDAVAENLK